MLFFNMYDYKERILWKLPLLSNWQNDNDSVSMTSLIKLGKNNAYFQKHLWGEKWV